MSTLQGRMVQGLFHVHKLKSKQLIYKLPLRNMSSLLKNKALIGGEWVDAKSGKTYEVCNPADGSLIGSVPNMGPEDANLAVSHANKAFQTWKKTSPLERSDILRKWYELLKENKDELAKLLTQEMGKPLADAIGEVNYGANFLRWFSEEARRSYGGVIPASVQGKRYVTIKQPVGVSAMITPWNFPIGMIARKAGPALAAGCTIVMRPAEDTPLSALALCQLGEKAGVPPGVINIVTSSRDNASAIGQAFCDNLDVAKLSFTGSTPVGKILLKQAADTVKRVSMELGGNAPYIVFESADVSLAARELMNCKFRVTGQTCVCANRIFVHESIHDKFVGEVLENMKSFKVGNGMDEGVNMGPLINERQANKVEQIVKEAVAEGGKVLIGGKRHKAGVNFFEPTVIVDARPDMKCFHQEIFGPVAIIYKFKTEDEVINMSNDVRVGLAGYFFSNDHRQIWRVAEAIETGMVGANTGFISTVEVPFGGIKESGLGREGAKDGLEEYLETKYICMGDL